MSLHLLSRCKRHNHLKVFALTSGRYGTRNNDLLSVSVVDTTGMHVCACVCVRYLSPLLYRFRARDTSTEETIPSRKPAVSHYLVKLDFLVRYSKIPHSERARKLGGYIVCEHRNFGWQSFALDIVLLGFLKYFILFLFKKSTNWLEYWQCIYLKAWLQKEFLNAPCDCQG